MMRGTNLLPWTAAWVQGRGPGEPARRRLAARSRLPPPGPAASTPRCASPPPWTPPPHLQPADMPNRFFSDCQGQLHMKLLCSSTMITKPVSFLRATSDRHGMHRLAMIMQTLHAQATPPRKRPTVRCDIPLSTAKPQRPTKCSIFLAWQATWRRTEKTRVRQYCRQCREARTRTSGDLRRESHVLDFTANLEGNQSLRRKNVLTEAAICAQWGRQGRHEWRL